MISAPGVDRLPPRERRLFVEQFEKDLTFIQLFYLLLNKSCPIKNVDLVWTERGPTGRAGLRHLGITEALNSSCSRLLKCAPDNPHPVFCNLINDFGRHEAESCAVSDKAAEDRLRQTGKSQVYRCNFGLVDIAVPVTVDGCHIATLFTGQVLREPPSAYGFVQIRKDTAHLGYLDSGKLEEAYWSVPVVTEEDLKNTTELLEAFAEFLANSWKRLADVVRDQRQQEREIELASKEFAYLVLDGASAEPAAIHELIGRLGLTTCPNRVILIRPDPQEESGASPRSFDIGWTTAVQTLRETCEGIGNMVAANLRRKGVAVFFDDRIGHNPGAGDYHAFRLAKTVLDAIAQQTAVRVRAGIGAARAEWSTLQESFEEANLALSASRERISTFQPQQESLGDLNALAAQLVRAVQDRSLEQARQFVRHLGAQSGRTLKEQPMAQRVFFSSVLNSLALSAETAGADAGRVSAIRAESQSALDAAAAAGEIQEAFIAAGTSMIGEVREAYAGRRKRMVERAVRIIEHEIAAGSPDKPLSISNVARELSISVSHLSRTFRRTTGETFERFTMRKRVEFAQRLLLEPRLNVVEVAERCGFSDPSYFARVFRKVAGCSPRDYATDPQRLSPQESR